MKPVALWTLLLIPLFSDTTFAITCGRSLIDIGDRKDKVYDKCGEPESTQTRTKLVAATIQDPNRILAIQQYEQVIVDEWIYNFGPMRFKQFLRFENNVLREIQELQRGN